MSLRASEEVVAQLVTKSEIRDVGLATGRYVILIEAFLRDHEHLLEFLTKEVGPMEGVTRVESALILRVAKFSYEWEIPVV